MKRRYVEKVGSGLLAVAVLFLAGCCGQQQSAGQRNRLPVETISSDKVRVVWMEGYQEGDKTVVRGAIQRQRQGSAPMKAHVDVQVLSSGGELLQEVITPEVYLPRRLAGRGIDLRPFEVEFQTVSVNDSRIVVKAHQNEHNDGV
ncbi:MAG: hypothetical protein JXB18_15040 [Sedimentisphaerales bacterium]|nr:hypothetical protein [Sedimentisphaerales bacterium]